MQQKLDITLNTAAAIIHELNVGRAPRAKNLIAELSDLLMDATLNKDTPSSELSEASRQLATALKRDELQHNPVSLMQTAADDVRFHDTERESLKLLRGCMEQLRKAVGAPAQAGPSEVIGSVINTCTLMQQEIAQKDLEMQINERKLMAIQTLLTGVYSDPESYIGQIKGIIHGD